MNDLAGRRATILAPAKVNLALHVLGRRADGYRDIDTLFQAIDLCDEVQVELSGNGVVVEVEGADVGPQEENLAFRAAQRFLAEAGSKEGVRVRLSKRIPVGAGLGGGSSDAAAVLRCLVVLLGGLHAARLHAIGAELGSDVPFFLGESPFARGTGRGELLEPIHALPAADLVLVSPPVHVSTAEAYAALSASRAGVPQTPPQPIALDIRSWRALGSVSRNDFEPVIASSHDEVARSLHALRVAGAFVAAMTGSGSTCYGLFSDPSTSAAVAAQLGRELGWRCTAARTLTALPEVRQD